jgi:hypothetical protein
MNSFHIHDARLDPSAGRLSAYFSQLFILAGKNYLHYALLDTEKNRFIGLADYRSTENQQASIHWTDAISHLLASDEKFNRNYQSVIVAVDSDYRTLIPAALYNEDQIFSHLRLNFNLPDGLSFRAEFLQEPEAWNCYGIEKEWLDLFNARFSKFIMVQSRTPLLRRFSLLHKQNPARRQIFLDFCDNKFELAAFTDGTLCLSNNFRFDHKEDVLYFTLYAAEQLKFRADELWIRLCGEIEEESETISILREYFAEVDFLGRPDDFTYSPLLDFPAHRYQSLYSLASCGS